MRTILCWVIFVPLRGDNNIREENGRPIAAVGQMSIVKVEELLVKQYSDDFSERTSNETE